MITGPGGRRARMLASSGILPAYSRTSIFVSVLPTPVTIMLAVSVSFIAPVSLVSVSVVTGASPVIIVSTSRTSIASSSICAASSAGRRRL